MRSYASVDSRTRLIRLGANQGRGTARATGVAESSGEWIATVDADIILPPHWYDRCRQELHDADAVAGIPLPDGDVQFVCSRYGLTPRPLRSYAQITGNNALYRRSVFDTVSYDSSLRNGEDIALSKDMLAAGLQMKSIDDLHVRHEETKDFRASLSWLYESGVGASRQLRRYREVRLADAAFVVWCLTLLAAVRGRTLRSRLPGLALPVGFTVLVGLVHTRNKFYLRHESASTIARASVSNGALVFAYFVGRIRGVAGTGG